MARDDVVVVGSGPNALAAAVTLARAGLGVRVLEAQPTVGGGARTHLLGTSGVVLGPGVPGGARSSRGAGTWGGDAAGRAHDVADVAGLVAALPYDVCSAVHPLALASPFLRHFDLAARGVRLAAPDVSYAHPLTDGPRGRAAVAYRDLARTVERLEEAGSGQGRAWARAFGGTAPRADAVARLLLDDRRRAAREPAAAAAFAAGMVAAPRSGAAGALFAGVAVHAMAPLGSPAASGTGMLLGTLGHGDGWPVPVGGSQAITDALVADLLAHGGTIDVGRRVGTWRELPPARDYVLGTSAATALAVLGDRLAPRVRAGLARFRTGPAAASVQLVLDGPVPWADPEVGRASVVHVVGSVAQARAAQAAVRAGQHAQRPVVLLGDPLVGDPGRARGGLRVCWAYAHVPAGSTRDVTADVLAQVERFAPGLRDRVVATRCVPAAALADHDENLAAGDIASGAVTAWQMLARPRLAWDPHLLGDVGGGARAFLASAATPPGPGVHGMGGWLAARSLLRRRGLVGPDLSP